MKKSELIKEIAKECNETTTKTKEIINTLICIITRELKNGNKVTIDKLGSFITVEYKGRDIISIEGTERTLETRQSPRFIASQTLKNEVKNKK